MNILLMFEDASKCKIYWSLGTTLKFLFRTQFRMFKFPRLRAARGVMHVTGSADEKDLHDFEILIQQRASNYIKRSWGTSMWLETVWVAQITSLHIHYYCNTAHLKKKKKMRKRHCGALVNLVTFCRFSQRRLCHRRLFCRKIWH